MPAKPIPDGFNSVSAYLVVPNSEEALSFYERAFGAKTVSRMRGPDGKSTVHAEMRIGNSTVMLSDENPQWGTKSARTLGGSPVSLHIYVEDADALFNRAVKAGCQVAYPMGRPFLGRPLREGHRSLWLGLGNCHAQRRSLGKRDGKARSGMVRPNGAEELATETQRHREARCLSAFAASLV